MTAANRWIRGMAFVALLAGIAAPSSATTLLRAGIDQLTAENGTIVVGTVLDTRSRWNDEGTFILTDVRVAVSDVVKGKATKEVNLTVLGGTVGDLTALIVGGAELVPGKSYVLFLNREDLPGAQGAMTVRDHCQGVFDIVMTRDGLRAVSQANGHPLVPDYLGYLDAPGGVEGMPLNSMLDSVRAAARVGR